MRSAAQTSLVVLALLAAVQTVAAGRPGDSPLHAETSLRSSSCRILRQYLLPVEVRRLPISLTTLPLLTIALSLSLVQSLSPEPWRRTG